MKFGTQTSTNAALLTCLQHHQVIIFSKTKHWSDLRQDYISSGLQNQHSISSKFCALNYNIMSMLALYLCSHYCVDAQLFSPHIFELDLISLDRSDVYYSTYPN